MSGLDHCHQGDVFSASFAAVPHVIEVLATAPTRAGFDFFLLPAAIEVARDEKGATISSALEPAYRTALARLPHLASAALTAACDADLCQSALAACAVAAGDLGLARLLIEIEHSDIGEVIEWYRAR